MKFLKRTFAAATIAAATVFPAMGHADDAPSAFDPYLRQAEDITPDTLAYHREFLPKALGRISGLHVVHPSMETLEALALESAESFSREAGNFTTEELVEEILQGVLSGLDPHSAYLDTDEYREMRNFIGGGGTAPAALETRSYGNIGHIRVKNFNGATAKNLEEAVASLRRDLGESLRGIVLDFRFDPGGLIDQAISVADSFLDAGDIVAKGNLQGATEAAAKATAGDIADGLPLAVLINSFTASAPEIVAGALQDNGRATIIGTRSFGKGSVQTVVPLSQVFIAPGGGKRMDALKVTTHLHYRPSGITIQQRGVTPDILTEYPGGGTLSSLFPSEASLGGLVNPQQAANARQATEVCRAAPSHPDIAGLAPGLLIIPKEGSPVADYQLLCAVEYLRNAPEFTVREAIRPEKPAPQ